MRMPDARHGVLGVMLAVVLLTGCGVAPSEVEEGGPAPTGLARGTTLYFLDEDGELIPSVRRTGRLGTVLGAVQLLMAGIGANESEAGLHTAIPADGIRAVVVDTGPHIQVALPFDSSEIGRAGVNQVMCTAVGVTRASGRDDVRVSVLLTSGEEFSRRCPAPASR